MKTFLDVLEREGLLTLEPPSNWKFDVNEIQGQIQVSETTANILERKVQYLPLEVKEVLTVASLLGYRFGELVLLQVMSASTRAAPHRTPTSQLSCKSVLNDDEFMPSLKKAADAGIIEGVQVNGASGYQFVHDKLQNAFRIIASSVELDRLHRAIGQTYVILSETQV